MSFQTFFAGLEAECEHILGIAVAAAPLVAISDPSAAAGIVAVNAAVAYAKPAVDAVLAQNGNTPITQAQVAAGAQNLLNMGLAAGVASGKIAADKATQIQAQIPVIAAIAAAANAPVKAAAPAA